jgi:two-component system OmpR family response regulator
MPRLLQVALVEDSAQIRERLEEALAAIDGVSVAFHAETENDALALLRATHWDVVILDLQLKQGTGLGVLKGLKADGKAHGIVAVFTNYGFPQYKERALALGAAHFFDKARDFDALQQVLRDLIEPTAVPHQ